MKKNFKIAKVGIFDGKLAREVCPDLIFPNKTISKKEYFNELSSSSICIADDGLKDTPGWKIGEYALMGKSIISTPINVVVEGFNESENYLKLSSRDAFEELPNNIEYLLLNKKYKEFLKDNVQWSKNYLEPVKYISNIFAL